MTTVNVIYRPSNKKGHYKGSLCLRLIYNRRVKTITLDGCRLYAQEWNIETQQVVYPDNDLLRRPALENIEKIISHEKSLVQSYISIMEQQGDYSVDELVQAYRNHSSPGSLSEYCRQQELLLIKSNRIRTARAYRSAVSAFMAFNNNRDIDLKDIDACRMYNFERYLKDRGNALNTISFYMRNLRVLYNKAVSDNIIVSKPINPFAEVFTGVSSTKKRALNISEVDKLRSLDKDKLPIKLQKALNLFFFCFYARGMSFIDMAYLRKDNIRSGTISYYRKKTGGLIEIKLTTELRDIIKGFSRETKHSPYVFPILKDTDKNLRLQYENELRCYNKYLKQLASLAGIDKPVSSHWARHSWATIAKYQRLPLSVISEGLGHRNEKTTYIYLASFEQSRLDEANRKVARATRKVSKHSRIFAST